MITNILKLITAWAIYSVIKTITSAQGLSMKVQGIIPSMSQGIITVGIKILINNRYEPVTFNAMTGTIYLNGAKIGTVNYQGADHIPTGTTQLIIPVTIDPLTDLMTLAAQLATPGTKKIDLQGTAIIDSISIPYNNELVNTDRLQEFYKTHIKK